MDGWWYLFLQVWSTKNDTTTVWFGLFGWSCDVYSVLVSQKVILEKLKRLITKLITKTDTKDNDKFLKTIFHVSRLVLMCRWVTAVSVYTSISCLGSPCPSCRPSANCKCVFLEPWSNVFLEPSSANVFFLNPPLTLTLVRFMQIPSALWMLGSLLEGTPRES